MTAGSVRAVFRDCVNGMPDVGQGAGWTAGEWRRAPRRRVPVSRCVGTNRGGYLDPARVDRYASRGGGGDPLVVEHRGRFYIADGHHRIAAAMQRGDSTVTARVMPAGGAR